jgi:hypothetical protein
VRGKDEYRTGFLFWRCKCEGIHGRPFQQRILLTGNATHGTATGSGDGQGGRVVLLLLQL